MKICLLGEPAPSAARLNGFTNVWSYYLHRELQSMGLKVDFIKAPRAAEISEVEAVQFAENLDVSAYDHVIALGLRYFNHLPRQCGEIIRRKVKGCLGQTYDGGCLDTEPCDITFTFRNDDWMYPPGSPNRRHERHHAGNRYIGWAADGDLLVPNQDAEVLTIVVDHTAFNRTQQDQTLTILLNIKYLVQNRNLWDKHYKETRVLLHTDEGFVDLDVNNIIITDYKRKALPYPEVAKVYSTAHLFMVTHRETVGLSVLETSMAGSLAVVPEGYIPRDRLSTVRHHVTSGTVDWGAVIGMIDVTASREVAAQNSWRQVAHNLVNHLQTFKKG